MVVEQQLALFDQIQTVIHSGKAHYSYNTNTLRSSLVDPLSNNEESLYEPVPPADYISTVPHNEEDDSGGVALGVLNRNLDMLAVLPSMDTFSAAVKRSECMEAVVQEIQIS